MTQERAVATVPQSGVAVADEVIKTPDGELRRIVRKVTIPAIYQYAMWRPQGQPPKVSLTSEGFAYINRELGVDFHKTGLVPDTDGRMAANPIHRGTYICLRTVGVWRNRNGVLQSHTEDVEVDYNLVYQDARINAKSAQVITDPQTGIPLTIDGRPVWEGGLPQVKLSAEDELKALKAFSQLRTFGLRYVQTIAATRILKRATGISSLPIEDGKPRDFTIEVITYADNLTPEERVKEAGIDLGAMFGGTQRVTEDDLLNTDELREVAEVEVEDMTEEVEREAVQAHVERQEDRDFDARSADDPDPDGLFDARPKKPRR